MKSCQEKWTRGLREFGRRTIFRSATYAVLDGRAHSLTKKSFPNLASRPFSYAGKSPSAAASLPICLSENAARKAHRINVANTAKKVPGYFMGMGVPIVLIITSGKMASRPLSKNHARIVKAMLIV